MRHEGIPHEDEAGFEEAVVGLVRFACRRHSRLVTAWLLTLTLTLTLTLIG